MRNGTVTVDGTNIWNTYQTFVSRGGYNDLVQWPSLKQIQGNDWQEMDGYEPDLSEIHLDTRDLDIKFVCKGSVESMRAFYFFLLSKPKMSYSFSDIGRSLTLRVVSMPSLSHALAFNEIVVRFAADSPLENYEYLAPSSSLPANNNYKIDGTAISAYGVRVLKGTVAGVSRGADVKPLLVRNISTENGATYDENPKIYSNGDWSQTQSNTEVTVRARDITLKCQMEGTASAVWRNYDALLYDLTKIDDEAEDSTLAGARTITIAPLNDSFKGFYKGQTVTDFTTDGTTVWIKFDLTLTLFSEDGEGFF